MTLTTTAPSSTDTLWAEEESTIFLPTHSVAQSVSLGGRGLMSVEDRERTPYVLDFTPRGVSVRLTDWVGRLDRGGAQARDFSHGLAPLAPKGAT